MNLIYPALSRDMATRRYRELLFSSYQIFPDVEKFDFTFSTFLYGNLWYENICVYEFISFKSM
ncbi:hypothetical protein TUM20903_07050 [Citrobacter koseri]|nr:hypothetical protein TUM20903_07050 [Citrobacter koseri]